MKKFQEFVTKDLGWKLLSLAIATIAWVLVININQPLDVRSYSKEISMKNIHVLTERGLYIVDAHELESTSASVRVEAQRTALDRVGSSADFLDVSVDLSALAYAVDGDTVVLPVDVTLAYGYTGYTIVSHSPTTVEVEVERLTSKDMPISLVINGEMPLGETFAQPNMSAEYVTISGTVSDLEEVQYVEAVVNAGDITHEAEIAAKIVAYDAEHVPVKNISTSLSEVMVSYLAYEEKSIPLQVSVVGAPYEGFVVEETEVSPASVQVRAIKGTMDELVYLDIGSVDVSYATSDVEQSINVSAFLPEGVQLAQGAQKIANVHVVIENPEQRSIVMYPEQFTLVGARETYIYDLSGQVVELTLTGTNGSAHLVDESQLTGEVNVTGLEVGTHDVMVEVTLPEGVQSSYAQLTIEVIASEVAEEETEDAAEVTPTETLEEE